MTKKNKESAEHIDKNSDTITAKILGSIFVM
jgi:hypothetical protein